MDFLRKKLKKRSKFCLTRVDSCSNLIEDSPTFETKKKKNSKRKPLNLIKAVKRDCKTLYQLAILKIGKEDQLLDDFEFLDYVEKIKVYQDQLNYLILSKNVQKKIKLGTEHTLTEVENILIFVEDSIKIGKEKQQKRNVVIHKKKKKKKSPSQDFKDLNHRVPMKPLPKETPEPEIELLIPEFKIQNTSDIFDDFSLDRQRKYLGNN
ncbi:hypothetical protein M0813_18999 [Anaeramoeba flamelloides]|uniref:Uncharacterized protein n=1 Tax=Anaeramoeba flamelloides TaxID=1746091 RepID=A0ABQ8YST3_9EUKA|nr:hypothetical protein M0813_18999 [Anaeramoeba flamelloides]